MTFSWNSLSVAAMPRWVLPKYLLLSRVLIFSILKNINKRCREYFKNTLLE